MPKTELTPNAGKYCALRAMGHRQADSYQQAYNCLKRTTARVMSTRLEKDSRVRRRIIIERDRIFKELDEKSEGLIKELSDRQTDVSDIRRRQDTAMAANRKLFERGLFAVQAENPNIALKARMAEWKVKSEASKCQWDYSRDARGRLHTDKPRPRVIKAKIPGFQF